MKRVLAVMMSICIVIMTINVSNINSYATSVIPDDDNTAYYVGNHFDFNGWNNSELLSQENYDVYFDDLSGDDKTAVINSMMGEYGDFTYAKEYATIKDDYTTSDGISFKNCYFKPIVINGDTIPFEKCHAYMSLTYGHLFLVLTYQPNNDDPVTWGTGYKSGFYSKSQFYISWNKFTSAEVDGHYEFSYSSGGQEISSDETAYGFPANSYAYWGAFDNQYIGWFYFDNPLIFSANYLHPNYNEHGSPNYEDLATLGSAWLNGTDSTGFVVDRRTNEYIEKNETTGDQDSDLGVLDGSFHMIMGGASVDDMNMLVTYELNSYTKNIRDHVQIVYDYNFNLSGIFNAVGLTFSKSYYDTNRNFDIYPVGSYNYIWMDMDEVMSKIKTNPNHSFQDVPVGGDENVNNAFTALMATTDGQQFHRSYDGGFSVLECIDLMSNVGLNQYSTYKDKLTEVNLDAHAQIYSPVNWDVGFNYKNEGHEYAGVLNHLEYAYLTITCFLKDTMTGDTSPAFVYTYDFKSGTATHEGGFETVVKDENDNIIPFDGKYSYGGSVPSQYFGNNIPSDYNITSGTYAPTANGGTAYGGAGGSVGDINISVGSGAAIEIVDLSSEEWLQHSPNYNNLITTLRTGVMSVKEDSGSVIAMLSDTYEIFPVEIWGYLALAIATISALSVIRYIRRG